MLPIAVDQATHLYLTYRYRERAQLSGASGFTQQTLVSPKTGALCKKSPKPAQSPSETAKKPLQPLYKMHLRLTETSALSTAPAKTVNIEMLVSDLPCLMTVVISNPLTRKQADRLNNRNNLIKEIISSAVAAPVGIISSEAESVVENTISDLISRRLRHFHSADIIIGLDAQVSGGIGPQRSSISLHVYSDEP